MSEWSAVIAVYWVLWALDGAKMAARRAFGVVAGSAGPASIQYDRWLRPPFLPSSWRLIASDPPLSFSPLGVSNLPRGSAGRPAESPTEIRAWGWDDIRHVGVAKGWIYINGQPFCPDSGHVTARELLAMASRSPAERERQLEAILRRWFRPSVLRRRGRVLVGRTVFIAAANIAALALLAVISAYVLADIPSLLSENEAAAIAKLLPFGLGMLLALHLAAVIGAWRARRLLRSRGTDRRRMALVSALLLPPQALKLRALLAENYLPVPHPLTAVLAFAGPADQRTIAFQVVADLRWPAGNPLATPLATGVSEWFATRLEEHVSRLLREAGIEPAELLRPPSPDTAASCRYCPRCHDQFSAGPAQCPHGVGLLPLAPAGRGGRIRADRSN